MTGPAGAGADPEAAAAGVNAPLSGLLVVELASVLAGPSVGQYLAELGARVIKIENPRTGGDVTRSWFRTGEPAGPGTSASYFAACNFGKESVALDLASPAGSVAVRQLIDRADILLSSFAPGSATRLGLDDSALRARNPGLIHGAITGYGDGTARPGYDAVIQAESGFMAINGAPDGPPTKMPVALVDLLAAHHLKEAILLQLLVRTRTGLGAFTSISLMDAALTALANQATGWFATGDTPTRTGSAHPNIAPYGTLLTTKDGATVLLAVGNDRQFSELCRVLEMPAVAVDPRFASNRSRVRHRRALEQLLQGAAGLKQASSLEAALREARVPAGRVRTVAEALSDPASAHTILRAPGVQGLRQHLAPPFLALGPPPPLGAHSVPVLRSLTTLSESQIAELTGPIA